MHHACIQRRRPPTATLLCSPLHHCVTAARSAPRKTVASAHREGAHLPRCPSSACLLALARIVSSKRGEICPLRLAFPLLLLLLLLLPAAVSLASCSSYALPAAPAAPAPARSAVTLWPDRQRNRLTQCDIYPKHCVCQSVLL